MVHYQAGRLRRLWALYGLSMCNDAGAGHPHSHSWPRGQALDMKWTKEYSFRNLHSRATAAAAAEAVVRRRGECPAPARAAGLHSGACPVGRHIRSQIGWEPRKRTSCEPVRTLSGSRMQPGCTQSQQRAAASVTPSVTPEDGRHVHWPEMVQCKLQDAAGCKPRGRAWQVGGREAGEERRAGLAPSFANAHPWPLQVQPLQCRVHVYGRRLTCFFLEVSKILKVEGAEQVAFPARKSGRPKPLLGPGRPSCAELAI